MKGPRCSLNHIDVSGIATMRQVFSGSKFNGDISAWNVGNVLCFDGMFQNSVFTGDISRWNTQRATSMKAMFAKSAFKGNISTWMALFRLSIDDLLTEG